MEWATSSATLEATLEQDNPSWRPCQPQQGDPQKMKLEHFTDYRSGFLRLKTLDFTAALVTLRTQNISLDNIFFWIKTLDTNSHFVVLAYWHLNSLFELFTFYTAGYFEFHYWPDKFKYQVTDDDYDDDDDDDDDNDDDWINVSKDAFRVCIDRTSSRLCVALFVWVCRSHAADDDDNDENLWYSWQKWWWQWWQLMIFLTKMMMTALHLIMPPSTHIVMIMMMTMP